MKRTFNTDGATRAYLIIMVIIVGLWLINSQQPMSSEVNDTMLYAVGLLSMWACVLSHRVFRNPLLGLVGGMVVYVALLKIILGIGGF